MAVLYCTGPGCRRWISISNIEGGNPTARANPEKFAQTYVRCSGCRALLCDRCHERFQSCPACDGALRSPDVREEITAEASGLSEAEAEDVKRQLCHRFEKGSLGIDQLPALLIAELKRVSEARGRRVQLAEDDAERLVRDVVRSALSRTRRSPWWMFWRR